MPRLTDNTPIRRVALFDAATCADIAERLDAKRDWWQPRSNGFFTLGAAAYIDACGGGSQARYRELAVRMNPVLGGVFADVLGVVKETVSQLVGATAELSEHLAYPGFHVFLASSLRQAMQDNLHLDLQYRHLPVNATLTSPTLSYTLPVELPRAGGGIEFCRPEPGSKEGRLVTEAYTRGELLVHTGRTLHRRAIGPVTPGCRRITLQGHALRREDGTWTLYW